MEPGPHDACPGSYCTIVACEACGEMLTNPTTRGEIIVGRCPNFERHSGPGRLAKGVILRRADCVADTIKGWSWCPVMERPVKDSEGHRPAAARLCNGTPHHRLVDGGPT